MPALTLTQARGLKGCTMNSLEGAMRFLSNMLERPDLDPTVRGRMMTVSNDLGSLYGEIFRADDVLLQSVLETAIADMEYERTKGVLQGME